MNTIHRQIFHLLKIVTLLFFFTIFYSNSVKASSDFEIWLKLFKESAINNGISQDTVNITFKNVKFLEQVIKYDRKQPEFFEDTLTYVKKRATRARSRKAKQLLKENYNLFIEVEEKFEVEKEILLALWGIETNFGKHVGKMDIISCLATLSFDKRRSKFFSNQLMTLLGLIDNKLIDPKTLYGSWAGAYGNFQFMPSTINNYAIDYDKNSKIQLKSSLPDALASAANYINSIGWKKKEPCFFRVILTNDINKKYINFSAKKISHKFKISKWKKDGIKKYDGTDFVHNYKAALIMPDGKPGSPTYIVFENYEKILKWNRSLRFGISVCTLSEMIKL